MSSLKIVFTNCCSVMNKLNELKTYLVNQKKKPDIIALCETWTNPSTADHELELPGYTIKSRHDGSDTTDGRGRGLLIYAAQHLTVHEERPEIAINVNQCSCVHVTMKSRTLKLFTVYRSPNSEPENNEAVNTLIRKADRDAIFIGDYNYPTIDWEK